MGSLAKAISDASGSKRLRCLSCEGLARGLERGLGALRSIHANALRDIIYSNDIACYCERRSLVLNA
jgi:hypothetical protein